MSEPVFKLIINPDHKDEHNLNEINQKDLDNMNYTLTKLGEARGWGGNPRWDLLFEAGFKALVAEKK